MLQRRIDILGLQDQGHLAPSPGGGHEADEQKDQGAEDLKAVGDAEFDQGVDPARDRLNLVDNGRFHLLFHHFFRCRHFCHRHGNQ